ncbi:large ribosomal subunit protein bL27m isoform X2 [Cavia porcellus]|uniref:large ribosomal subunit protein bL27m isoform X2 n=1 Tax=Cavia porcellus TaxID=10141 RepID=UPI002FDF9A72
MAAAALALRTRAVVSTLLSPPCAAALAVRCASKKTGGSSKNLGGKSSGKRFGIKKMEGHYVHAGNILATQRQFRWHPGAHSSCLSLPSNWSDRWPRLALNLWRSSCLSLPSAGITGGPGEEEVPICPRGGDSPLY